jgi:hypothetical protein
MSKMVMHLDRICVLVLAFLALLASHVCAQGEKGKPKDDDIAGDVAKKIASSNVIMVAKLVRIDEIGYSGFVGSYFIFEVKRILKFEAGDARGRYEMSMFHELSKRNANLAKAKYLEFKFEYVGNEGKAEHERLLKLLRQNESYIIAAPMASFDPFLGLIMPNKWGSVGNAGKPIMEEYSQAAITKIESLVKKPDKNALSRKQLVEGHNEFALNLYRELKEKEGNLFFSPLGISASLSACHSGARGQTAAQMEKVLFSTVGLKEADLLFAELLGGMKPNVEKHGVAFGFADALWGQKGIEFQAAFAGAARTSPVMELRHADFKVDARKARQTINEWAREKTDGKFPEIAGPGIFTADTELAQVSVSPFTGKLAMQFDSGLTRDGAFAVSARENTQVPFMHARFDYTRQANRDVIANSFRKTGMLRRFPGLTVDLIAAYPEVCENAEAAPP